MIAFLEEKSLNLQIPRGFTASHVSLNIRKSYSTNKNPITFLFFFFFLTPQAARERERVRDLSKLQQKLLRSGTYIVYICNSYVLKITVLCSQKVHYFGLKSFPFGLFFSKKHRQNKSRKTWQKKKRFHFRWMVEVGSTAIAQTLTFRLFSLSHTLLHYVHAIL